MMIDSIQPLICFEVTICNPIILMPEPSHTGEHRRDVVLVRLSES